MDHSSTKTIEDVKSFWEAQPLWTGESKYLPGTREFFDEHRAVILEDCFAGALDPRIIPDPLHRKRVLDLGCGPGFWIVELSRAGCEQIVAADLTDAALALAESRCKLFGVKATFCRENAESLSFVDGLFSHVNCHGVIHHSPDTEACVREIARVLEKGGTASLSVYYRNAILKLWPILRWPGKLAAAAVHLSGRGRERLLTLENVDELVRQYDGADNPIGKAYSRKAFVEMLSPYFHVHETFLHYFPCRALPCKVPRRARRWLDRSMGFLIYARLTKR
jgi:ubiquinone/menaquinone biosynthesis C-methylase UbiE